MVDDACPQVTGYFVEANRSGPRVLVLRKRAELGVGGATANARPSPME